MKGAKNELSTGLTSGHYTAAVYCKQRNTFYYCNDETISEIESLVDGDYTSTVYMIVYERQWNKLQEYTSGWGGKKVS